MNKKKGIAVKIDTQLHAEVRQCLEEHEMMMAEFVSLVLQDVFENVGLSMGMKNSAETSK